MSYSLHYFPCVVDKPLLIVVKMIDPIYIFIDSGPLEHTQLKDSSYLVQSHTLSKDTPRYLYSTYVDMGLSGTSPNQECSSVGRSLERVGVYKAREKGIAHWTKEQALLQ